MNRQIFTLREKVPWKTIFILFPIKQFGFLTHLTDNLRFFGYRAVQVSYTLLKLKYFYSMLGQLRRTIAIQEPSFTHWIDDWGPDLIPSQFIQVGDYSIGTYPLTRLKHWISTQHVKSSMREMSFNWIISCIVSCACYLNHPVHCTYMT